ncbi:hypothetical protein Rsub_08104 [Raphidocelis subcapitata]|uniref:Expansin-like EG45 domain-containing protein n=1 Tax=Raphidocelis subcapitata TaxID=307507 RepID=A0A2V0P7Z3_9CHLO|nr:hypothetical protein Rsub_08104 [Raphidocelis subcapitata]|eukprot:GBF95981.1 hypothetical protein Rsub_08104 [Raphidocelis subcapitata]
MARPVAPAAAATLLLLIAAAAAAAEEPSLLAAAAGAAPPNRAGAAVAYTGWYNGSASFYGGPQDSTSEEYNSTLATGSCGYGQTDPKLWPFYLVAGVHPSNPILSGVRAHGCGACIELECTGAGCHVNLHVFGFELIAPTDIGSVAIRYRRVACAPVDPIAIHVDAYRVTKGGWLRLALKNVAGDQVTAVELVSAAVTDLNASSTFTLADARHSRSGRPNGWWRHANNTFGAAWELNGVPPPPLHMRLRNAAGQMIVIANAIRRAGTLGDIKTNAQFPPPPAAAAGPSHDRLPPPPGSYIAPGTADVLVFQGPDPEPLAAPANSTTHADAASPGPAAPAAQPGAAYAKPAAGPAAEGEEAAYDVAGYAGENGDGFADQDPQITGMPAAPHINASAPSAARAVPPPPPPGDGTGPRRRAARHALALLR